MAPQNKFVNIFATRFLSTDVANANHLLFNNRHTAIHPFSSARHCSPLRQLQCCACNGNVMPMMVPVYYTDFAAYMNEHDTSGFGWAYIHDADGTIAWTDGLVVACPEAFYVRDHKISEAYLPRHVAITQSYFEKSEHLHFQDENCQNRYHKEHMSLKRSRQSRHAVDSKESMEQFARCRQALHDVAERATAAAAAAEAALLTRLPPLLPSQRPTAPPTPCR
ncbi:hypothetical protein B0H17DRAFT_1138385 [Mycena rosella]|uniref:Uncharacterized protein n=1 Tax=Mycena rosella TaxID=1033263 RepID=A0AAD7D6R0_MYCRO|nr:hypothetical protein B0H17DRAFT_1138385 [Mycena rosella]